MENHIEEIESGKHDKGFTLVELLIVIVILGILATVTVFAVQGITDTGQENTCSAEKKTLETAVEAYYAQEQAFPADAAALATAGLLRDAPTMYAVDNTGAVTAVATGPCA